MNDIVNSVDNIVQASNACANWWADQIFGGRVGSSGDGMIDAMSLLAGRQGTPQPTNDKREAFVTALSKRVSEKLARMVGFRDDYEPSITVGVDYGPDRILSDAAEEAGLRGANFPWKTMTWTYPTHFVASLGYGAASKLIWSADDWDRPQCRTPKYDEKTHDRLPWVCSGMQYHEEDHTFDIPQPLCIAKIRQGLLDEPTQECNRPENYPDWHQKSTPGWESPMYHEFAPGEVK